MKRNKNLLFYVGNDEETEPGYGFWPVTRVKGDRNGPFSLPATV